MGKCLKSLANHSFGRVLKNMETVPVLRRFPLRMSLCLYCTCVMLAAGALITLYLQKPQPVTTTVQNALQYSNAYMDYYRVPKSEHQTVPPGWSWSQNPAKSPKIDSKLSATNKSDLQPDSLPVLPNAESIASVQAASKDDAALQPQQVADAAIQHTSPTSDSCREFGMGDVKTILLWTPFFENWNYFYEDNFLKKCRCGNCEVTTDRSDLQKSNAVIFHARDVSLADLPAVRYPHQRWVFYCLESPPYSDFPGLQHMKNMFNWTMTYRSDSDIVTPYGSITKNRPSKPVDLQELQWVFSNKTKSVIWMCSHCPTHGNRDAYISELKKYIDVDIYGDCGDLACPRSDTNKCFRDFAKKYKFFLAFENTICKDYITEKFFRTLKYNIIPVVFGGGSYTKSAPPSSFIDALSFKSPKHLAFFLTGVGKDFKLYSNYFRWRKDYSVNFTINKECDLCSKLHLSDKKPSSYSDLRQWWVQESQCRIWGPK